MKEIPLTQGKVAIVDDEDFERVNQFRWYASRNRNRWYAERSAIIGDKRHKQKMHRFILGVAYGDPLKVDHKDRVNTLDNRRSNLRVATIFQNNRNVGLSKRNMSGIKGVWWDKRIEKWTAEISVNSKTHHLGSFSSSELAARAYDAAALKYHENFAVTNAMLAA